MALLMVVLTGFAALAIDAGVAYDQSRTDQDVSDAAALAASYWIYSHANTQGANLSGAFAAAANVAQLDCTGPSAPCSLSVSFYTTYPGTATCSASAQSVESSANVSAAETQLTNNCSTAPNTIADAGASVGSTGHHYLSSPVTHSQTFSIGTQAVAQVVGGTTSGSSDLLLNCVLCILAQPNGANQSTNGFSIASNSDDLNLGTDGANIDVNGNLDCEGGTGDTATIDTEGSSVNGTVDVAGTYTDNCTPTWEPATSASPHNPTTGTTPIPDPLANLQMPNVATYASCTASVTITSSTPTAQDTLTPGCYGQITIDGTKTGGSSLSGGQTCLSNGDGLDVIFDTGLYVIYQGLTIEGDDPTVESQKGTGSACDQGVTLDFVCSTSNYNGTGQPGPAACSYNSNQGQNGAELILDTYNLTGSGIAACYNYGSTRSNNAIDETNGLPCDWQWNLFPPTSGSWTNLVILYDQNNTSPIETASQTPDPDSDHNGAIYAARATYIMANYSSTNTPLTTSGNSCITPLGSPVVIDYLQVDANYNTSTCQEFDWADGNFVYQMDNDVELNAGGPGGLVG
jgi:hypothetical protein